MPSLITPKHVVPLVLVVGFLLIRVMFGQVHSENELDQT